MSTHEKFIGLIRTLATPAVFYLPPSHIDDQVRGMFDFPLDTYLNKLLYVTGKGKTKSMKLPAHLHKIISKRTVLEESVFKIADFKDLSGKRKFKYLIDRYMLFLNAMCFYSEILYRELKEHFPDASDNIYLTFKIQYHNFLDHRKSIIEVCNIKKLKPFSLEDFAILGSIESPIFNKNILQYSIKEIDPISKSQNDSLIDSQKDSINEIEVEKYLLETVFNIN
ncbi:hypothetical protein ACFQO1_03240 [Jejudonia soesokkakensis]|uniref:Uncharacterized protein n=1 Tax=Jejudonia soesokkakensis TaxID=1323432 RepID=A0ABW2MPN2_9FLAO